MMKKTLLTLFAVGVSVSMLMAQATADKAQLEKERENIQKELQEIQGLYNKVKGQTKQSLGQLSMLKRKINLQERYISNVNREIRMIDDDIYLSNLEIYRLQKQLDTLKAQYARTVVYAYKNRSAYDYLNFIFSASSFNDAIRRIGYLKSYRGYREKQVNTILETTQLISKRKQQQLGRKDQKNSALENQTKQMAELAVQKKEKDVVVSKLKSQENSLQKQIAEKKKRDKELNNAILAIVRREIKDAEARAAAEAKKNNVTTNPETNVTTNPSTTAPYIRNNVEKKPVSYLNLNEKDVALNSSFEQNRGKLPWPVDNGIVTYHFSTNNVEGTLLKFDSPGITITTPSPGSLVKVVFDGEVAVVNNNGDGSYAVIVRHGKYFTTYSNLVSVTVSRGTSVKTGQVIGKAGRDDESNGGQIDFILMIETKNVNPEIWLR